MPPKQCLLLNGVFSLLIVIGAEAGAIIARSLGYEAMRKRFGDRLSVGLLGSQNAMM
ncbi:MAG: hypothetical protein R6V76_08865 [Desulfobacterales bacterium]